MDLWPRSDPFPLPARGSSCATTARNARTLRAGGRRRTHPRNPIEVQRPHPAPNAKPPTRRAPPGLPKPDAEKYPADGQYPWHQFEPLAVSLEAVEKNWVRRQCIFNDEPKGFQGIAFNLRRPPFDQIEVRQAFSLLLDRQLMNEKRDLVEAGATLETSENLREVENDITATRNAIESYRVDLAQH